MNFNFELYSMVDVGLLFDRLKASYSKQELSDLYNEICDEDSYRPSIHLSNDRQADLFYAGNALSDIALALKERYSARDIANAFGLVFKVAYADEAEGEIK